MNTIILEKIGNIEEIRVDVFSRLLQNRVIFIDDLVTDRAAIDIIATLLSLDKEKNDKVTIFINSEGGDLRNVFAIYDAMQLMSSTVETFCIGSAMREAVLLLSAGTKGHRIITKNADVCVSQVMSHYISHSDLTNTKISHDKTLKDNEAFLKELSKNTSKSLKELKKVTERQLFLTASQAVAYGIADKVV
jgi:ATP-dependent Clp protease, protease subunit